MTEIDCAGSRKGRPNYAPEFRREVVIAACEPGISVAKLAQSHGLNPNMVFKWRRQYLAGLLRPRHAPWHGWSGCTGAGGAWARPVLGPRVRLPWSPGRSGQAAVVFRLEKVSRHCRPGSLRVPPLNFCFFT